MNLNSEDFNIIKPSKSGEGPGPLPPQPTPENIEPWDSDDDDGDDDGEGEGEGKSREGGKKPGTPGDYTVDTDGFGEPIASTPGGLITKKESKEIQEDLGVEEILPAMSKEELRNKIRQSMNQEGAFGKAQEGSRGGGGQGVGGFRAALAEIVRGKVNWKRLLRKFIGSRQSGSRSVIGNRRWLHSGAYLPTRQDKKKDIGSVVCAVDVSASMSDIDIAIILTEIKSLVKARGIDHTVIIYFHSHIEKIVELKSKEAVKRYRMESVKQGGTSFKEPLAAMERYKKDGKLELGIFLTDGEPNSWDFPKPTYLKDFIWVIINNSAMTPPWGNQVIHITSEDVS
jgi:predicted metal-dependent peptidase